MTKVHVKDPYIEFLHTEDAHTYTHSPDKLQLASFSSCFTANRLFCSSTYNVSTGTNAPGFYLWAQASLCELTKDTLLHPPPKNLSAVFAMCRGTQKASRNPVQAITESKVKSRCFGQYVLSLAVSCVLWL